MHDGPLPHQIDKKCDANEKPDPDESNLHATLQ